MIHEVYSLLAAALRAKGVPFEFRYGPQQVPDKVGGTRLEMSRDYGADEAIAPGRDMKNPRMAAIRRTPAVIRIFARSTLQGAQRHDHERLADTLADMCLAALPAIVRTAKTTWAKTNAGLVADKTADGWAGVVYEIRFTIDRGVYDTTFAGAAAAEFTAGAMVTTPDVSGPAANPDLPNATTRLS